MQPASSTRKGLSRTGKRRTSSFSTANPRKKSRGVRAALALQAVNLRPPHQPALHTERMEQLRHRLTNVSPKGQRRSVDQNTLKRTDLDDLESPASPAAALRSAAILEGRAPFRPRPAQRPALQAKAAPTANRASGSRASPTKS